MIVSNRVSVVGVQPTVGDLRRAREVLLKAGDISSTNVADALGSILHGRDPVLALGLKATTGRRSALTVERIAARDDLLRRMALRHYPDRCASAQAREIATAAEAYWRRAARLDVALEDMPDSYRGMPREFLFHVVRLPATVPSMRTLRLILTS
ncbi:hypothetical protein [Sphingomonas sp. Leaf10]|uniref:hypothetical protein n=1 Tax=Sphingomonas sp. Leaf10 TaxID=1735676 RepID=UPI0006F3217D|nr:hypothetical protein [Sphingomonas sp. Leaf10]KQM41231.1 hypothetical protein ASE59_02820 [Sphingomonas sp. Leaf10]